MGNKNNYALIPGTKLCIKRASLDDNQELVTSESDYVFIREVLSFNQIEGPEGGIAVGQFTSWMVMEENTGLLIPINPLVEEIYIRLTSTPDELP